ncbi:glutamyl-Q tRNA(Asp) synthetase [Sinobacterium caligoides]|uniref:Glutamyl-Q tRNA(Asp) synthetase n=1 Tax=Sinobacterium caligoides TaxID=933926 RepID=A0A3N2DFW5_9GAMM|nr:tRNA glutamyl-Q(34) synthetase GluQRS [Sinobacterium caligoides]ROR98629.1 glutamyl-Q tRNA(Asp) synthetase [Sinobacterium caligoides]
MPLSQPPPRPYVGRFAPSPTGPLHMGSLISALASYLDAKANHGQWLIRIEDLDPPREVAGASEEIVACLAQHGLYSDRPILKQSSRLDAYEQALERLQQRQLSFYCQCSRAQLKATGSIYPGYCRHLDLPKPGQYATRLRVDASTIQYHDGIQGPQRQSLADEVGDFIIKRKDQLHSYQLAVVVDDHFQGVSHVVRGADLLSSTERQLFLARQLDYSSPQYAHLPVLTNDAGQKLSKQTFAPSLDPAKNKDNILFALKFLNQPLPPKEISKLPQLLFWATQHWQIKRIAAHTSQHVSLS